MDPGVENPLRLRPKVRREVDQILLNRILPVKREGFGRKWLGWPGFVARIRCRRNGPLLDRPKGSAGHPVENEAERLLGHLGYRLDLLAVLPYIQQDRAARQIVVPEPVMHELVVPDSSACPD